MAIDEWCMEPCARGWADRQTHTLWSLILDHCDEAEAFSRGTGSTLTPLRMAVVDDVCVR